MSIVECDQRIIRGEAVLRFVSRTAPVAALVAAVVGVSGEASATPTRDVDSALLNRTSLNGHDYITRDIVIAPGGSTGWHWHDGELVGVVKQGTLTHNALDCSIDGVYNVGDAVIEPSGADHVHIGRNLGSVPTILQVIYVDPIGKPLAEDAANPGCDFD